MYCRVLNTFQNAHMYWCCRQYLMAKWLDGHLGALEVLDWNSARVVGASH
jgi:hypothetical protein